MEKTMRRSLLVHATIALALAGAGCTSTPLDDGAARRGSSPTGMAPGATPRADVPDTSGAPVSSTGAPSDLPAHRDPRSAVARQRSVFFDYDDFAIRPPYRPVIETQGRYLRNHPQYAIRIEGHSDERGSAEYNLALGQRRAEAVMRALNLYGVPLTQMEPVSFGKERPSAPGHDEAAWAQNRRADVAYRE
jgi:peptidoglycan-associated lipoprotein